MTEAADLAAIAEQRGATYWLLSRLVLEPPALPFLQELGRKLAVRPSDPSIALSAEVNALADAVAAATASADGVTELLAEHTRLWSGLSKRYGPPPPYESVLLEDRLPGDATTNVAFAYAQAGLAPEVPEAGPADHLANELRFIAMCCAKEAEAWHAGERGVALAWLDREVAFLTDHLLQWAPAHTANVAADARTVYHRVVGTLIERACRSDGDDVQELRAELG